VSRVESQIDAETLLNIDIENISITDPIAQQILKDYEPPPEGFDKIGFVRPLGGFFYEFAYAIAVGLLVALTYSFILKTLYPFPDSKAYANVGNILFSFLFFVMNIPTEFSLSIFIAKYRVKNPYKMVEFIRFYIWYQMLTGVGLVTLTSIYVLYILKTGNLVYTKWLLLIYISREYPAMTNVYNSALKGLQRFDFQTKINYAGQIISPATEFIFVLIGRFVLGRNPVFGEIMGIAIGFAIGTYVDDFFTMLISIHYMKKILKPLGFSIKDTLVPRVEKSVWKESLIFGLKLSPPGFVNTLLGFFSFFWWYDMVPAYATLLVLNDTADKIANIIRRGGGIYLKGTMSESLNNGKKKLTEYYLLYALKFSIMTMFAIGVLLYSVLPIISEVMFISAGLETWLLTTAFITPNIIESTTEQLLNISSDVILGGNRAGWNSFMSIFNSGLSIFIDYVLLFVLKWPQNVSIIVLVWIVALKDFPNKLVTLLLNYTFIQLKMVKIHYSKLVWQALVAPLPPSLTIYLFMKLWTRFVHPMMTAAWGVYIGGGITALVAVLSLLWIFFPLYTFFGGWDDHGIDIFEKAVEISGPSKFLFRPIVLANKLLTKSGLHNRFAIPYQEAVNEAEELMKERFVKDRIIKLREEHATF
ncbi:MAG: hypothetical protein ACTSU2_17460, partial [Promethearchaeota archaeon]